MKRVLFAVLATALLLAAMAVPALAFEATADCVQVSGGNTYAGPFSMAGLTEQQKAFLTEWASSDRNMLTYYNYFKLQNSVYYPSFGFYIFDSTDSCRIYDNSASSYPMWNFSGGGSYRFMEFSYADGEFYPTSPASSWQRFRMGGIVSGSYLDRDYVDSTSRPKVLYLDYTGDFILRADSRVLNGYNCTTNEPGIQTNQLTVLYRYEDGTSAGASHTEALASGTPYSVATPPISGYIPDRASVAGTMGTQDTTVTVTYKKQSYRLTVQYQYEGGGLAGSPHTETLVWGSAYNVPTPPISGCTPDRTSVSGTMPKQDTTVTVTYTEDAPPEYGLTVVYQYEDGSSAAPARVESHPSGAAYSVDSPAIAGYTPDQRAVSGTMPSQSLQITVVYTKDKPPPIDPPIDPPVDPPSDDLSGVRVLDYPMFEGFFNLMRDSGGALVSFFLKAFLLCSGLYAVVGIFRKVVLAAVSHDDPPMPR